MCLAQGHKAVPPVRLKPTSLQSQVKPSTTEPRSTLNKKTVLKTFAGLPRSGKSQGITFSVREI